MPELPEVETIVRRLNSVLSGKKISKVDIFKEKSFQGDSLSIINAPITKVSRRAKFIRLHLSDGLNLLAHLKMTGQFIFVDNSGDRLGGGHPTADWVSELPSKHTRIGFTLLDENEVEHSLFFNDMRIFGWVRLLSDKEVEAEYSKYAPDVNTDEITSEYFQQKLSRTARKIKQVVLDNKIISGVGNIYACDGLNLAKIDPLRPANSLSKDESARLLQALKDVINLGIELGGATIDNYRTVDGFAGGYQNEVLTYGREGEVCKNCPGIIEKIKIGGRGTYFCPSCQK
jgi:formamidopyrimidine-DNA glycosylase